MDLCAVYYAIQSDKTVVYADGFPLKVAAVDY